MSASVSPNTPCGAARPPPAQTRLAKEIARQMLLRDLFMPHAPPLRVPSPESGRKALMRGLFMPNAPQTLATSAPVRTSHRPQRQADVPPPHPVLFVGQPGDVQAAGRSDPVPVVLQPAPVRAMARPNLQILVPRSPVAVQPYPVQVKPAVAHAKCVTFAPEVRLLDSCRWEIVRLTIAHSLRSGNMRRRPSMSRPSLGPTWETSLLKLKSRSRHQR
ncbi:hypothetical protein OF83DRAFT_183086 [Amylostereum chailletii]|nr:hypothetical protein OF83DRAFT_183086 [Amylostereum chailletii]